LTGNGAGTGRKLGKITGFFARILPPDVKSRTSSQVLQHIASARKSAEQFLDRCQRTVTLMPDSLALKWGYIYPCIEASNLSVLLWSKSECGMFNNKSKSAWTPPVLELIEMAVTSAKIVDSSEMNMNCTGPANSSSPPGCGS
jgi:hypothetical protein